MDMMETAAHTFAELVPPPAPLDDDVWAALNAQGLGVANPQSPYLDRVAGAVKSLDFFLESINATEADWDAAQDEPKDMRDAFMNVYRKIERMVPDALEDPGAALSWAFSPQLPIENLKKIVMLLSANLLRAGYQHMGGEVRIAVQHGLISQRDAEKSAGYVVAGANTLLWLAEHRVFDPFMRPRGAPTPSATNGFGLAEPVTLTTGVIILIGFVVVISALVVLGVVFMLVSGLVIGKIVGAIEDLCDKLIERGATPEQIKETCTDPLSKMAPNLSDALKPIGSALSAAVWGLGIIGGVYVLAKVGPDIARTFKEARA